MAIGYGSKDHVVPKDDVISYAWFIIATMQNKEGTRFIEQAAKQLKPVQRKKLTPEQITKAEALVKEMIKKNPKLLNKK